MPRSCGPTAAFSVPGIYAALLDRERERHVRQGVHWIDYDDHSAGCFVRDRRLLDLLEARKPVIIRRASVGHKRSNPPVYWPYPRGAAQFVQVNPDDTIAPARDLDPHADGRVAEGN